jgi:Uncharacterized protein conserved in bacteria (DUF2169)
MKIIKPQTLSLLTRPFEFRRDYWLGCAVVAFLPIGETHTLLPEADLWPFLTEELPSDQPLDAAIPKTRTEFVAIAHAFAPGGVAAPMVPTGIQLGASIKQLVVFGDREFDRSRGRITEPVPFTRMKIDWTRAYGGDGFADNPLGTTPPSCGICPTNTVDGLGRRIAPSSLVSVITPIERNSSGTQAAKASGGVAAASDARSVPHIFRQLNTWFEFSPWRRATSATDVPGRKASSTISRFSSRDHERREPVTRSLVAVPLGLSSNALKLHIPSSAS